MSAQTNALLPVLSGSVVLALRLFALVRSFWTYPQTHGPGIFFGVQVPGSTKGRESNG
jgi:hypothetical protein